MCYSMLDIPIAYLAAPNPKCSSDFWNTVLENKENIFNPSGDNNTLNVESRPTTPVVEPRPTIPMIEPRPEVLTIEPRPLGSSSQVNTPRVMDTNNFIWREDIHSYKYSSNQDLQTSINSHIKSNVSNTMNSSGYTFQSNLNPRHVNFTVGNQNTIMQNVAESSIQAQSNIPQMGIIAESSIQAQSNIPKIRVIAESGFTKPNLKPPWIEDYTHVVNTNKGKFFNPMFSSSLPWQEIQLPEITKLNRPKIVGINFDFSHQNIEVILQEFGLPKAFYVSHEHVPGLTISNYKEYITDYYHTKACNRPSILLQAVLLENGDVLKVIKSR
uniref:Uncharacterized protein n=1 Tax=Beauveria caledonica TaxID=38006 RepID=A0A192S1T7_9HYPO|nr:hypothetical protein [Beauveria caledonica]AMD61818.1 hypothetical protein [Beauveria caledonica]